MAAMERLPPSIHATIEARWNDPSISSLPRDHDCIHPVSAVGSLLVSAFAEDDPPTTVPVQPLQKVYDALCKDTIPLYYSGASSTESTPAKVVKRLSDFRKVSGVYLTDPALRLRNILIARGVSGVDPIGHAVAFFRRRNERYNSSNEEPCGVLLAGIGKLRQLTRCMSVTCGASMRLLAYQRGTRHLTDVLTSRKTPASRKEVVCYVRWLSSLLLL